MKNFLYSVLAVLLCIIVAGGVALWAYEKENSVNVLPNDSTTVGDEFDDGSGNTTNNGNTSSGTTDKDEEPSGGGDSSDSGNTEEPTPTVQPLTDPANKSSYIAMGLEMIKGASIRVIADERPAIRFMCKISSALKEQLDGDSSKQVAMLLAPMDYFDAVNTQNYTYIDWVSAFEKSGKTYVFGTYEGMGEYGEDYMVRFTLTDVLYQNTNRKFVALGCIVTTIGSTVTYKYAAFPSGLDYRSNARSCAYVATAALNAHATGLESFSEENVTVLKNYINESVDQANGLTEATNDGSRYALNITSGTTKTLTVGQSYTIKSEIVPNVEVPILYKSSNVAVAVVDTSTGKVTAVAKGTATIYLYLAGEEYSVTLTVT